MARKHKPEEIIGKLREEEIVLAHSSHKRQWIARPRTAVDKVAEEHSGTVGVLPDSTPSLVVELGEKPFQGVRMAVDVSDYILGHSSPFQRFSFSPACIRRRCSSRSCRFRRAASPLFFRFKGRRWDHFH